MRKIIIASFVALAVAATSCDYLETVPSTFDELDITFDVADSDPDTKAIKLTWQEGDEILIGFRNNTENGQQAKLKYISGVWRVVQKPSGLNLEVGRTINFDAIHFPGTISYDKNMTSEEQLGYAGGSVRVKRNIVSGALTGTGVLPLGTINLNEKLNSNEYQVVVPGISASTPYTLNVTCNGRLSATKGRENWASSYDCAYSAFHFPYFYTSGSGLTYGGGIQGVKGVANADGVAFACSFTDAAARKSSEVKDTDPYKYVFSLYDGESIYYYTIAKNSEKTIAAGKAIKLPAFDGKGAQTYWKTRL